MLIIIYILIVAAAVFIFSSIFSLPRLNVNKIRTPEEIEQVKREKRRMFISFVFPFTKYILEKLNLSNNIRNKLVSAHVNIKVDEYFNIKLVLIFFTVLICFFAVGKLEIGPSLGAAILGYMLPDIWLSTRRAQRRQQIVRIVPETVDLLGLCVEAGLDFTSAIQWIVNKKVYTNPIIEELDFVLEEIRWGKSRSQALKDMAKRLNIPEINSFVRTLVQAERMGTPVIEAFTALSEDTRLQRFRRGERYAAQAPIKILLPLVFCIMPVIAIIVGGPILLQFMKGGFLKGIGQ